MTRFKYRPVGANPSAPEPESAAGVEPTAADCSRGDGNPLDQRWLRQGTPFLLQHLEVTLDGVLGHRQGSIMSLALGMAARPTLASIAMNSSAC